MVTKFYDESSDYDLLLVFSGEKSSKEERGYKNISPSGNTFILSVFIKKNIGFYNLSY